MATSNPSSHVSELEGDCNGSIDTILGASVRGSFLVKSKPSGSGSIGTDFGFGVFFASRFLTPLAASSIASLRFCSSNNFRFTSYEFIVPSIIHTHFYS